MIQAWAWRKSSSSGTENCVEIACTGAEVHVRDSKRRSGRVIAVAPAVWDSFLGFLAEPSSVGRPVADRP